MTGIEVSHLSYTYPNRAESALADVSTELRAGEVTLIAGTSGCGKTTVLRCINGLIPLSYTNGSLDGSVTLFGRDNSGMQLSDISQVVGTVLQDPERQIVASDVMSEIAFGLENLGLPRAEIISRIDEVAGLLEISPLLGRETFQLSGGEKQKVALAGVLAMRPQALLLDEPLASLDPASGHEALLLLRQLAERGIAVVIVEHRVEDVLSIAPEHCVYMSAGRVTFDGDAAGLMQAVDWREIKLPAQVVIQRIRRANGRDAASVASRQQTSPLDYPALPATESTSVRSAPLIEFDRVHFGYEDGAEILHDVSFAVQSGDRIAVLGPNGAGKTTLVKHAIGLNRPTSGQIRLQGHDSRQLSVAQIARTVGYVFQSPSHMLFAPTVREELSFGPQNLGLAATTIAENVEQALRAVNLQGHEDTPPLAMSYGQQKRVTIASILTMNPRVLVMDEPSAGQDYASYTHFMEDIVGHPRAAPPRTNSGDDENRPTLPEVASAYDAVLFISHDLDLAITFSNRVLIIANGRLVAYGATQDVLQDRDLLQRCRIVPTSLLEANLAALPKTGRMLGAPDLAAFA